MWWKGLLNLTATDNIENNFGEEWRFHINWNAVFQVKQKSVT